jgi:hypothetical protein
MIVRFFQWIKIDCVFVLAILYSWNSFASAQTHVSELDTVEVDGAVATAPAIKTESTEASLDAGDSEINNEIDSSLEEPNAVFKPFNWLKSSGGWIENQREFLSDKVQSAAIGLDRYISRDSFDEGYDNESYAQLRLINRFLESGVTEQEVRVSGKVDLPNGKRNAKLIFDTDPDDFDSLEDKQRGLNVGTSYDEDKSKELVAGVQVVRGTSDNWARTTSAGIKLRSQLDPFFRVRFLRQNVLTDNWEYRLRETFFYFHTEGFGVETESDLYWILNSNQLVNARVAGKFLDADSNWEWLNSYSLNTRIDRNNAIEYQLGVSANSQPTIQTTNYWVRSTWQHRLYKNWLYFKAVPEVTFERENDFSASLSLTFELEIFFSDDKYLRDKRIRY